MKNQVFRNFLAFFLWSFISVSNGQTVAKNFVADSGCGVTFISNAAQIQPRTTYTWRITPLVRNQRLVMALEYYGAQWAFRTMQPGEVVRMSPSRAFNSSAKSGVPVDGRGQVALNCNKQSFAIYSTNDTVGTNYRLLNKLLLYSCDGNNLMGGTLAMSLPSDTALIVEYVLKTNVQSSEIARFTFSSWAIDSPQIITTTTRTNPRTTTRTTTTTTTTTPPPPALDGCPLKLEARKRPSNRNNNRQRNNNLSLRDYPFLVQLRYDAVEVRPGRRSWGAPPPQPTREVFQESGIRRGRRDGDNLGRGFSEPTSRDYNPPPRGQRRDNRHDLDDRDDDPQYDYQCNGILVSPGWVLTARRCVYPSKTEPTRWQVVLGASSTTTQTNENGVKTSLVASFQDYDSMAVSRRMRFRPSQPDVLMVQLATPFQDMQLACLADDTSSLINGSNCISIGWDSGALSGNTVEFIDSNQCKDRSWRGRNSVGDEQVCGLLPVNSQCMDNNAEVLMCPASSSSPNYFQVVGIATDSGQDCGRLRKPAMYSSIPYYKDFIQSTYDNFQFR